MHQEEKEGKRENKKPFWKSHGFLMLLCCLVPMALIAFFAFGFSGSSILPFALLLLCPLMHLFLMKDMHGKGHNSGKENEKEDKAKCH